MLKNTFDSRKPYKYVCYRRMSSDMQNERSPEQQGDTISATVKRGGFPWVHLGDYTDSGISGRYVAKRPEFQRMLSDIRSGKVKPDLILVDTFERFGRAEELASLRRELEIKRGVLVLTADSQFSDPTSTAGRCLSVMESMRSTDDSRLKAHNVLRGKRDTARLGHWLGGAPPFGYKLETVFVEHNGRQEVDYCRLIPDPKTAWIIKKLFATALEKSWGSTRLARMLNEGSDIPDEKKFCDATVNNWMKNPIYYGELLWEKNCCGIIDDARVIQKNAEEDVLRVPNFCEPLVTREDWDAVQALRKVRSERTRQARENAKANAGKQFAAVSPGMVLRYILAGLVRCGHCNRSMVVSSTGFFTMKSGQKKRYPAFVCPGHSGRSCPNGMRVPEPWLRELVINLVKHRLFPSSSEPTIGTGEEALSGTEPMNWDIEMLQKAEWFAPLLQQIQAELNLLAVHDVDRRPVVEGQIRDLKCQTDGWMTTLANPNLDAAVRSMVEGSLQGAIAQKADLERQLHEFEIEQRSAHMIIDPREVVERLNRLFKVLAANDPTQANLELSLHIDVIRCFQGGKVVVRTCKLGAVAGAIPALSTDGLVSETMPVPDTSVHQATPRRRPRLRVVPQDEGIRQSADSALRATDVNRFPGLGPEWFHEDVFQFERAKCWAEENAKAIAAKKATTGWSLQKLAEFFERSKPTIAAALRFAAGHAHDDGPQDLSA